MTADYKTHGIKAFPTKRQVYKSCHNLPKFIPRQTTEAITMRIKLPRKTLSDHDLMYYVKKIKIPNFREVSMRDELTNRTLKNECGILNLQTHLQKGTHWTCWFKRGKDRYYFDSYGEPPPLEMIKYLKTPEEYDLPVIKRSAVTVQHDDSSECGALCLYVLKNLSEGREFAAILEKLLKRYKKSTRSNLTIQI